MVSGLEDACRNLKLTDVKLKVIVFDDDGSDERMEQIALCLYGQFLTEKSFSSKAMKSVFCNIWKLDKGVVICDVNDNLICFQMFASTDKEFVLYEGPWSFDWKILLLKEITSMEIPSEVKIYDSPIWLKAYDLPAKKHTIVFAHCLGKQLGTFVSYKATTMFGVDMSLCFRVDIDITKPLRRGVNVMGDTSLIWVRIKYVSSLNFPMVAKYLIMLLRDVISCHLT